ncbi:nucleotidyltransferase domain-containing protein [Methylophaga sp. SB9B]|uniref:nucleotidyltransferase family protein n=1 Tax=Methylophaga sp. SB9B TaxID=2570356 RepID=UPI0010A94946|nr:nucleotidyltransferase domain-containing protein [Methylophaga sp. SB9B]THK41324.1 nucleotidyltransferase domain-containing protein [Methylophaga sp. SB9B]
MTLEETAKVVNGWAAKKPQIEKVQFFGSRVRGTNRDDSDLDVAITLLPNLDESDGMSTWFRFSDVWSAELNDLLPYEVQVEWEAGELTSTILKGLSEASYLVYKNEI